MAENEYDKINRYIHEELFKECWHEPTGETVKIPYCCVSHKCACGKLFPNLGMLHDHANKENPNYHTPDGFFRLWDKCREQEWWMEFIDSIMTFDQFGPVGVLAIDVEYVDPATFPGRVKEWME